MTFYELALFHREYKARGANPLSDWFKSALVWFVLLWLLWLVVEPFVS